MFKYTHFNIFVFFSESRFDLFMKNIVKRSELTVNQDKKKNAIHLYIFSSRSVNRDVC